MAARIQAPRYFGGGAALGAQGLAALPNPMSIQVPGFLKLPLATVCFLGCLYFDTVGRSCLSRSNFVGEVGAATLELLPYFPLLSLLIACALLGLGELWEHAGLPTSWLNGPIYYGIFYGPFAYVYIRVKAVAKASSLLPLAERKTHL